MHHRVLISSSSFLDTPGQHLDLLKSSPLEVVSARGPLSAEKIISIVQAQGPFAGFICGEDEFNSDVIESIAPHAKVISKYGVGIDKIDLSAAERNGIKVANTPGVNHTTVAELTIGLLLSLVRQIPEHNSYVHAAQWRRLTGVELAGKTLGIVGFGRVGREVAIRAMAFGMQVVGYNSSWSRDHRTFAHDVNQVYASPLFGKRAPFLRHVRDIETLLEESDFVSLHMNLTKENRNFLNATRLARCRRGVYIINVSRAALVEESAIVAGLRSGAIAGYATDVFEPAPVLPGNPLLGLPNVVLTPQIGSRTVESVERQGTFALRNLLDVLRAPTHGSL
ncbi:MAG: phosphoglycerate dehydrogenase [Deltaproteobacteria bacterium]|nr:phosphoglycerate dehydrogenase [Deltaproteobacteria bacterium]